MYSIFTSMRLALATIVVCVLGYAGAILGLAQLAPETATGSLITGADGKVIGSRLIAQNFTQPRYFWPRPSAAGRDGYDGMSAAGSNKSPTSKDLTDRATKLLARHGATAERPLPPDLATASGSGLDPHISLRAALYQAERVARERRLPAARLRTLIEDLAFAPGGFLTRERLVNVLELNLALDRMGR